jgi:hypothetical protein
MKQIPLWASTELLKDIRLLWNRKINDCIHKSPVIGSFNWYQIYEGNTPWKANNC